MNNESIVKLLNTQKLVNVGVEIALGMRALNPILEVNGYHVDSGYKIVDVQLQQTQVEMLRVDIIFQEDDNDVEGTVWVYFNDANVLCADF